MRPTDKHLGALIITTADGEQTMLGFYTLADAHTALHMLRETAFVDAMSVLAFPANAKRGSAGELVHTWAEERALNEMRTAATAMGHDPATITPFRRCKLTPGRLLRGSVRIRRNLDNPPDGQIDFDRLADAEAFARFIARTACVVSITVCCHLSSGESADAEPYLGLIHEALRDGVFNNGSFRVETFPDPRPVQPGPQPSIN